jgi:hypothetical protein
MADLISPMPNGTLPGSGYWNDWIEKLRSLVNGLLSQISWANITGTPTTLAGYGIADPVELTTHKDAASGYAGLDANSRITKGVKTTDDVIVDSTTTGLVLKSPNLHYWRFSISNAGVVTTTDLGLTSP